jgi:hypothetical protein
VTRMWYPELERCGRLGNQLWQIGSTIGLARRAGIEPLVAEGWSYRPVFSLPDEWYRRPALGEALLDVREQAVELHPWTRPYLQHLPYIDGVAEELRAAFTPSPYATGLLDEAWDRLGLDLLATPRCAVHVRRGDVLTNPPGTINVLPASYYLDAMNEAHAEGAATFVVFTDDPDWCRANLAGIDRVVSGAVRPPRQAGGYTEAGPVDWRDMLLMARFDMHVCSNATYGWWGAWLHGGRKVWTPTPWFGAQYAPRHEANRFVDGRWPPPLLVRA